MQGDFAGDSFSTGSGVQRLFRDLKLPLFYVEKAGYCPESRQVGFLARQEEDKAREREEKERDDFDSNSF